MGKISPWLVGGVSAIGGALVGAAVASSGKPTVGAPPTPTVDTEAVGGKPRMWGIFAGKCEPRGPGEQPCVSATLLRTAGPFLVVPEPLLNWLHGVAVVWNRGRREEQIYAACIDQTCEGKPAPQFFFVDEIL